MSVAPNMNIAITKIIFHHGYGGERLVFHIPLGNKTLKPLMSFKQGEAKKFLEENCAGVPVHEVFWQSVGGEVYPIHTSPAKI